MLGLGPAVDSSEFDRPALGLSDFEEAQLFARENRRATRWYCAFGRWACIPFSVLGIWVCLRWGTVLYGGWSGLLALTLWGLSPYVLGHGATMMADAHASSIALGAGYCFWRWLKQPDWLHAFVVGIALGLAELCKFTLLIFYPLLPALWVVYRLPDWRWGTMSWRRCLRQGAMLLSILLLSVYIINCGYLFDGTLTPLEKFRF